MPGVGCPELFDEPSKFEESSENEGRTGGSSGCLIGGRVNCSREVSRPRDAVEREGAAADGLLG
jgi:hypothetical protein